MTPQWLTFAFLILRHKLWEKHQNFRHDKKYENILIFVHSDKLQHMCIHFILAFILFKKIKM